jgi:hypothetical protein
MPGVSTISWVKFLHVHFVQRRRLVGVDVRAASVARRASAALAVLTGC